MLQRQLFHLVAGDLLLHQPIFAQQVFGRDILLEQQTVCLEQKFVGRPISISRNFASAIVQVGNCSSIRLSALQS
ncbi:MAG: hypothetical protein IPH75_13425 [bacterium]|nr:hypothetical protein [bacterium]